MLKISHQLFLGVALVMQCGLAAWQAPLTPDEVKTLNETINGNASTNTKRSVAGETSGRLSGREVLLVELQKQKYAKESAPRLADVYFYNYTDNVMSVATINVDTKAPVSTRTLYSVHLPLNYNERQYVQQLLADNPGFLNSLSAEYQRQFGLPLSGISEVDMKVSIRVPLDTTDSCHVERCALVSVFTRELYNFSIEPVVNLQRGTIDLAQHR